MWSKKVYYYFFFEKDAFHDGFHDFKRYLDTCAKAPRDFQGTRLLAIMDTFGPALHKHLVNEPPKLASLSKYPIDIKAISEKLAKHSLGQASTTHLLPLVWYNLDVDFEEGRWRDWPPMPWLVRWIMVNVLSSWCWSWWRFGSVGADGRRVKLLALRDDYQSRKRSRLLWFLG